MNRCHVCDVTDEDNPSASISYYTVLDKSEAVCLVCANSIAENLEDLSLNDTNQSEVDSDWYKATLSIGEV